MKKLLAAIAVLCLICGAAALATSETLTGDMSSSVMNLTYTQGEYTDYVVTIPANVNLVPDPNTGKASGNMEFELDRTGINKKGFTVCVKLLSSSNNLQLKNGNNEVSYQIQVKAYSEDPRPLTPGGEILTWRRDESSDNTSSVPTLGFYVDDISKLTTGIYTDTLTFVVETSMT